MAKKIVIENVSTEEKIKSAARKVFMLKGFSATRTRDIATEAGINLALLNYYFRSKQKLFESIMQEKVEHLFGVIAPVLNNSSTTFDKKVELIVSGYIDEFSQNPDIPIFVLNEMRKKNFSLIKKIPIDKAVMQSVFFKQLKENTGNANPVQFLISILGMTVFPFVSKPMLIATGITNEKEFPALMTERKKLIPIWVKAILKSK